MTTAAIMPDAGSAEAAAFVRDFHVLLRSAWELPAALALHERLDALATAGDAAVGEQAIALSVYLCSFMEGGRAPDVAQREHMRRLAAALAGGDEAVVGVEMEGGPLAEAPPLHALLCVSEDHALVNDLSCLLRDAGIAVIARSSSHDLVERPLDTRIDAMLVDAPQLAEMSRLLRCAAAGDEGDRRALLFALTRSDSLAERMFALRAGADEVLAGGDAAALAPRLITALQPGRVEPYRVLIVDDDRAQTAFCEAVLRGRNIIAASVNDPLRAIDEIKRFDPEIILLDLHMPTLDGIALAQRIRALPGAEFLSIVFLTGETSPDTRFDLLAAGGDDYFPKPIQPRHLITGVIGRARRARSLRQHMVAAPATADSARRA